MKKVNPDECNNIIGKFKGLKDSMGYLKVSIHKPAYEGRKFVLELSSGHLFEVDAKEEEQIIEDGNRIVATLKRLAKEMDMSPKKLLEALRKNPDLFHLLWDEE